MTSINACPPMTNSSTGSALAIAKAGWRLLRAQYRRAATPQRRTSHLDEASCRQINAAVGRATVMTPTAKRSSPSVISRAERCDSKANKSTQVKDTLRKHQPTCGEVSERDCAMCGKSFPCAFFVTARAELAALNGAQPPREQDHEEPLTALRRSLTRDADEPGTRQSPTQRWQAMCHRITKAASQWTYPHHAWEPWGLGFIRLAKPGALCTHCRPDATSRKPRPRFEVRFDGMGSQVLCWTHLLTPADLVQA